MTGLRTTAVATAYRSLQRFAPGAYVRLIRWRGADFYPVTPTTDLVIAGAPGSANSYARAAFLLVNPGLYVASHAHVWTEVRDGVRHGRPVVLLVREPLAEAASRLTRFANMTPAQALRDYAEYHEQALRWREQVVVAGFEEVTTRLGDVLRRVNERFGTAFVPFPHDDPDTVAALNELLRSANGAIPTPERAAERAQVRDALLAPALAALRARCEELHRELVPEVVHRSDTTPFEAPQAP